MAVALRRKPLIDDVVAVQLRNNVYEAQDAREKYDAACKKLNEYSTWLFVKDRPSKRQMNGATIAEVKRAVDDLEQTKAQCEFTEHKAYLELGEKILKLVPAPIFEGDDENEVPEHFLSNGDCYMLLNFVEFLCKRGLMQEPTFLDAKRLVLDFDNYGAD